MQVETRIKVSYITTLGDHFDSEISEKDREELTEQHIRDYCKEHALNRNDVKILS